MLRVGKYKFNCITVVLATVIAIFLVPLDSVFAEETPQTHLIEIRNLEFAPKEINVKPGDIVKWINHDFIPHTATANDQEWNSGFLDVKASWQMTVDENTFEDYFCIYHPNMTGKIKMVKLYWLRSDLTGSVRRQ